MAETEGAAAPQAPQVKMNVLGQFIRDISFENILAQKGVTGEVQPDIQVQVTLDAKKRPTEHQFDISMKLTSHRRRKRATMSFLCWSWIMSSSSTSKACRRNSCIRS